MIKMRLLHSFLTSLLLLCLVHSCAGDDSRETVVMFKDGETEILYNGGNGAIKAHKPFLFRSPAFVGGVFNSKEFLAILCGANLVNLSGSSFIEGVARTSYGNHSQWSALEFFTNDTYTSTTHALLGDFTAVMKENKIYVLATSYYKQRAARTSNRSDNPWDILMFVGTITDSTGSNVGGAFIKWEEGKSIKKELQNIFQNAQTTHIVGGLGNGIATKGGAIVFPICIHSQNNIVTSSILYSTDNGSTWKIGGDTEVGTYEGSVVEWEDGKLLFIVSSDSGYRKVFESDNMGATWNESFLFSRVWGNEKSRNEYGRQGSAIKVPVNGKDMLLFAHPSNEKSGSKADTLRLWLSDGRRIVRIGTISDNEKEHNTGNSILAHVGDHLYITHQINPYENLDRSAVHLQGWERVIGLTPLSEFFESAKNTMREWQELDKKYTNKGIPAEALVGFLGTAKDNSVWADEYKCVDATVNGGESVIGGFRFDGNSGSGAEWPVESQGQNQFYAFTEKQFTLAATVTIHTAEEEGEFSLIGASLNSQGSNVLIGLGYTHDNKWIAVSHHKKKVKNAEMLQREKEYHVALTFANGAAAVFVDGVDIAEDKQKIRQTFSISHLYMGAIEQSSKAKGNPCTVKNVMLFNRALEQKEIAKLTEVSKNGKLGELASSELPTVLTDKRISVVNTKLTEVPEKKITVSKNKLTEVPENSKSVSKTKLTEVSEKEQQC